MTAPTYAQEIVRELCEAGHEAYFVGGCVRDMIRGAEPHDWDVTTDALPERIIEIFGDRRVVETGLKHGTVTVLTWGGAVEVTTYRRDGGYLDHRRPESVTFVTSLEEDLIRRDFTVNAMAWTGTEGLIDPFGGESDLRAGILRAVGEPGRRFDEDALRILRGLRFCSELGFEIETCTLKAMREKAPLLRGISGERIFAEIKRLCTGENAFRALMICPEVLAEAIPEIGPTIGFDQRNRHHIYDVWEHTCRALASSPRDELVRLALLLHDLGKPASFTVDASGEGHFYGHAKLGAEIAERVMKGLHADGETIKEVTWLVMMHDRTYAPSRENAARMLSKWGFERTVRLLELKIADNSAHSPEYSERLESARSLLETVNEINAAQPCLSLKELAVRGGDLTALGMEGPEVGETLKMMLEAVISGRCENERSSLLGLVGR